MAGVPKVSRNRMESKTVVEAGKAGMGFPRKYQCSSESRPIGGLVPFIEKCDFLAQQRRSGVARECRMAWSWSEGLDDRLRSGSHVASPSFNSAASPQGFQKFFGQ